ncbi:sperm receptor for egg jelly-like [Paramuricea clavata]|uniref:Sperm receptor for egg jelly-like n=1 Tax=Paramuricea clavata TaxID=317549 RepID=A0A7D9DW26_PARCT|nr:sperm receptor for egg jelly-like [Paramuricea clavata]
MSNLPTTRSHRKGLSNISGVQFFFSCITCVTSNARSAEEDRTCETYPSIAYFVVYRENAACNGTTLFSALHNHDVEPEISPIRVRTKNVPDKQMETAARQLFQVVKDHNNEAIQEMLDVSNVYCYQNVVGSDEEDSEDEEIRPTHFPTSPCALVIVNQREFSERILAAAERLRSDGLVVDIDMSREDSFRRPTEMDTSDVSAIITKIEKTMRLCDHALFRSQIYAKPAGATFTYVRMMDVTSYLHKLLSNDCLKEGVMKHFHMLEKFLSHPACEVILQLQVDVDLVEVSNGFCFSIRNRSFRQCPIDESMRGKISPRAFVPYDCSTPPTPAYFRDAILNSFEDPTVRVNFLNKFYQCLIPSGMPQKVRKLVVAGPKDSGKTSWASVFHRIIPAESIASITNERQFSASMVTDDTQLVIVDDWSASTMQSDLAKTILQGGWMVTAVKHGEPRRVMNNSPYYITTNNVPDFRDENENVERRIQVFNTTSLPSTTPGIDRWIYDNAMDCIVWIAEQLEAHYQHIAKDELWYEPTVTRNLTIPNNEGPSLFQLHHVRDICPADFEDANTSTLETTPTIHERFVQEYRTQHLEGRRRRARGCIMDTDEDNILDNWENPPSSGSEMSRNGEAANEQETDLHAQPSASITHEAAHDQETDLNAQPSASTTHEAAHDQETDLHAQPSASTTHEAAHDQETDLHAQPSASTTHEAAHDQETDLHAQPSASTTHEAAHDQDTDFQAHPSASTTHEAAHDQETDLHAQPSASTTREAANDQETGNDPEASCAPTSLDSPTPPADLDHLISTPPEGWQLNSKTYFQKVAHLIKWCFNKKEVRKAHVHHYQERLRKAELRRTPEERNYWVVPDPTIDASMLMLGRQREIFNMEGFACAFPQTSAHLENLRKNANVRVMRDRCPFSLAVQALRVKSGEAEEEVEEEQELDRDGDPANPPLSSQTYWTKIKTWRPW